MKERPILFNSEMVRAVLNGRKTQTRRVMKPQLKVFDFEDLILFYEFEDAYKGTRAGNAGPFREEEHSHNFFSSKYSPYGKPGDQLWVRETWNVTGTVGIGYYLKLNPIPKEAPKGAHVLHYKDQDDLAGERYTEVYRPSIHMPRWASRIQLEVTNVRVERVQEISEEDAHNEGVALNFNGDLKDFDPENMGYMCQEGLKHWKKYPEGDWPDGGYHRTAREAFESLWDSINAKRGYAWSDNPWVWVVDFKVIK